MKRNVLFVLLALTVLSASYAQAGGDRNRRPPPGQPGQPPTPAHTGQTLSVTGNLELVQGMPALVDGGITWYAPGLLRYAGFIEGLKEGARVTIEGQALAANPQDGASRMLSVSLLTIGSKSYDLAAEMPPPPPDEPGPPRGGPEGGPPPPRPRN
jgi:hypothetical protein